MTWLYERFAARTWLRWRAAGAGQMTCDTANSVPHVAQPPWLDRVTFAGIDLAPALRHWLRGVVESHGPRQSRLLAAVDEHFAALQPDVLVLDEDATPMARAAILAARRAGIVTVVVQHGVPRVRFGFAPPAADLICAWGESSRQQFIRWGVQPEHIVVTGCPRANEHPFSLPPPSSPSAPLGRPPLPCPALPRGDAPEFLFFATTPPRDERPDALAFHFTRQAHEEMLRMACRVVSQIAGARLTIKLHPRCRDTAPFAAALADYPQLRARLVRGRSVQKWVRRANCVLNCTSSAGIEAAQWGVPVIELIPRGSVDLLPADEWGTAGTARDESELAALVHSVLAGTWQRRPGSQVFAQTGREAAVAVADTVLRAILLHEFAPVNKAAARSRKLVRA